MSADRQALATLAKATQEPANPMVLAGCLGVARSRGDIARSLALLEWLRVLGLPVDSLERQRSALQRTLDTFEHRDRIVEQTGPFETLEIDGIGPLSFSVATAASRAFLDLVRAGGRDYEPGVLRWMVAEAKRGAVIADVGAHIGYYSTILAAAGAVVVAVEMHPDLLLEVRRNLWANKLDRAHVINAAVGDHDGLIFNLRFNPTPGLRVNDQITAPPPDAYRKALFDAILCVRLDTVFGREQIIPDLVKLDVEGYEVHALHGAKSLIEGGRTKFLIEFHPHVIGDFGHTADDLFACFPEGWHCQVLEDDGGLRPLTEADRRFEHNPDIENVKLLFSPPA
ncbi:MAG: FkbM family methyltransferase [Alphaproteobacteria bacterium]|nr:FkbM family methyltransferase [Alphaproteobacteria bacterium]